MKEGIYRTPEGKLIFMVDPDLTHNQVQPPRRPRRSASGAPDNEPNPKVHEPEGEWPDHELEAEMKNCPFCGSQATLLRNRISCDVCACDYYKLPSESFKQLVANWNQRA